MIKKENIEDILKIQTKLVDNNNVTNKLDDII